MTIRKGSSKDIDKLLIITNACAEHMISQRIYQWDSRYPNYAKFEEDVERDELYVIEIDTEIIGCITISTFMDAEYIPIKWLTPNKNNVYIHRLAIHPKFQGKGYAQRLMDYAENYAKEHTFKSIRLDTFSQNKRNLKFYESRGYKRLEEFYFLKQSSFPFYCYELVL